MSIDKYLKKTRAILKSIAFALLISSAFCGSASAQSAEDFFKMANDAYAKQDFPKAEENYTKALANGGNSAQLYFNMANACAKNEKRGKAMLNYLRALYENPRMREASANLKVFAKENSLSLPTNVFSATFISELSNIEWTIIAFVAFWLTFLFIFIPPLYGKKSVAWIFLSIICAGIFALSATAIFNWYNYASMAVAEKDNTPLMVSPVKDAPVIAILPEGQIASIIERKDNFIYVKTPYRKRGWTSIDAVVPIVE